MILSGADWIGSLTVNGGTLAINGSDNQFGTATIAGGTVSLDGSGNYFDGNVTISNGGALNVAGTGNAVTATNSHTTIDSGRRVHARRRP